MNVRARAAQLASFRQVGRAEDDLPQVRLTLSSGVSVEGVIVAVEGATVVVDQGRGRTFVDLGQLAALTVVEREDARDLLSDGALERPGEAPDAQAIQRRTRAISDATGLTLEVTAPPSHDARLALGRLLEDLLAALRTLLDDRPQVREVVRRVRIEPGGPGVRREGDALVILAQLDGGAPGRLRGDPLVKAMIRAC